MADVDTLRIEARFKNARLYNAIVEDDIRPADARRHYAPVKSFCERNRVSYTAVLALLTLRLSPFVPNKKGRRRRDTDPDERRERSICLHLCAILARDFEYLFPAELYRQAWPALVAEVPAARFVPLLGGFRAPFALPPMQDDNVQQRELHDVLTREIDKRLTPRQAEMLRRRFGLDGRDESDLRTIGQQFGIGPERTRQIIYRAMGKLRGPNVTKALRPFIDVPQDGDEGRASTTERPLEALEALEDDEDEGEDDEDGPQYCLEPGCARRVRRGRCRLHARRPSDAIL